MLARHAEGELATRLTEEVTLHNALTQLTTTSSSSLLHIFSHTPDRVKNISGTKVMWNLFIAIFFLTM